MYIFSLFCLVIDPSSGALYQFHAFFFLQDKMSTSRLLEHIVMPVAKPLLNTLQFTCIKPHFTLRVPPGLAQCDLDLPKFHSLIPRFEGNPLSPARGFDALGMTVTSPMYYQGRMQRLHSNQTLQHLRSCVAAGSSHLAGTAGAFDEPRSMGS